MAKFIMIVPALLVAAGFATGLEAQTFKVQKFSIGGEGGLII